MPKLKMLVTSPNSKVEALEQKIAALEQRLTSLELAGVLSYLDFIPTLVQSVGVTFTTQWCRWARIGRTVFIDVNIYATSSGTTNNAIILSLPSTVPSIRNVTTHAIVGNGVCYDASINAFYPLLVHPRSSIDFYFLRSDAQPNNLLGVDPNFAIVNTDQLSFNARYETSQ